MNLWIRKILNKLIAPRSEQANQTKLQIKFMPYKEAYFFTHVPKTGGTSFIVFLDRFFPAKVIFPHQLWNEIGDFKQLDKQEYNLVRGHFGGCTADIFTDKAIRNLTILRDPVKLAYSTYEYVRRENNTALHELVLAEDMSFETFLTHPKTKHLVTNRMVHNLVFGHGYDVSVKDMSVSDATFAEFRKKMNRGQVKLNNEDRLKIAIEFLQQSLWFGILEQYDDAVRLLCYKMSWPPQGVSQRLNVNKVKPVITDKAREIALSINKMDSELYQLALKTFKREFAQMKASLGASDDTEAEQLDKLIDLSYQRTYVSKYNYKLTDYVRYDCAEILLGGQWHRREWNALDKSYFRWSGPSQTSYLDFWVISADYLIEVKITNAISTEFIDHIKVDINGHLKQVVHKGHGKSRVLQIQCKATDVMPHGLLRINFHSQDLQPHKTHFNSDDNRVVGFALGSVEIKKNK